jgi:hypothetical protein
VRKKMGVDRKVMKKQEMEESNMAEERWAATEKRLAAPEVLKAQAEEKRVAMEEKNVAMEDARLSEEREDKIMFLDTSGMSDKQKNALSFAATNCW